VIQNVIERDNFQQIDTSALKKGNFLNYISFYSLLTMSRYPIQKLQYVDKHTIFIHSNIVGQSLLKTKNHVDDITIFI